MTSSDPNDPNRPRPRPGEPRPPTSRMEPVDPGDLSESTQGMPAPEPVERPYTAPPSPESYAPYEAYDQEPPSQQVAAAASGKKSNTGRTVLLSLFVLVAAALLAVAIAIAVTSNSGDNGSGDDQAGGGGGDGTTTSESATTSSSESSSETSETSETSTSDDPAGQLVQVEYELSGNGLMGGVALQLNSGLEQHRLLTTPYSTSTMMNPGDRLFVRGTVNRGTVSCIIRVNGVQVDRQTRTGPVGDLSCGHTIPG